MKKNMNKMIALTLAFAVLGSTAAYANVMKGETTVTPIASEEVSTTNTQEDLAVQSAYITNSGKITDISDAEDGNKIITIDNENGGLRFVVAPTTCLVDRVTNAVVTADTLTKDMQVMVVYGANSPMGMSMPPYLGNVTAVVTNADKGNVCVGLFNDELVNEEASLQLNIADGTQILSTLGTRSILSADDVKGKNAMAFYDVTTRSIPAQTTPSLVVLLEERQAVETTEETTQETDTVTPEPKAIAATEMVALRDAAEAKGYAVKWQGKDQPVLVTKDDITVQITLDSVAYSLDGGATTQNAAAAATLVNGVLCVSEDVIAAL